MVCLPDVLKTFLINFSDANCFYLLPWVKATIIPSPSYFLYVLFKYIVSIGIKKKVCIIFPALCSCHKKYSTGRKPETNIFLTTALYQACILCIVKNSFTSFNVHMLFLCCTLSVQYFNKHLHVRHMSTINNKNWLSWRK